MQLPMERNLVFLLALCASAMPARAQQPGDLDADFSADGIATTHFAPIGVDHAMGVAIQPDGRIVVVGSTQQDLQTHVALARYMPDGTLDPDFGTGGQVVTMIGANPVLIADVAFDVAIQPDGKIVVVGSSFANGSGDRFMVARYTSTGVLDPSFGTGGIRIDSFNNGGRLGAVAIRDDGYIVACGVMIDAPSNETFLAARYTPSGMPDPSFGGDGFIVVDITPDDDVATDFILEPGGSMVMAGYCGSGNNTGGALVRLAADGSLDPSLDGDGILITQFTTDPDAGTSIVRQPADGKMLVSGYTTSLPFVFFYVARYNTDGSLDNSFAGDGIFQSPHPGINLAGATALAPDGRIVIGGSWGTNFLFAMVNPDGTADLSIDPTDGVVTTSFGTNAYGNDLALQSDGKAVLVGSSGQGVPTANDFVLLRYHTGIGVGMEEDGFSDELLRISPNPANDDMRLDLPGAGEWNLEIHDATGRLVHQGRTVTTTRVVDTREWSTGLYTVVAQDGNTRLQRKVAVVR